MSTKNTELKSILKLRFALRVFSICDVFNRKRNRIMAACEPGIYLLSYKVIEKELSTWSLYKKGNWKLIT